MNAAQFLESLSNIGRLDYMHSRRQINPAFFLKRISWLVKQIPGLMHFCLNTNFVHITGTSGKGTTGAILQSILACADFKVGFYNSPHVVKVYERIRIANGKGKTLHRLYTISPQTFDSLTQSLKPYLEKSIIYSPYGLPSYFEILLTIALLYFQQKKCDYIILEAGCGGRYDAVNIIPRNILTIITNIGYDHEHLIGPKLSDIAYEKAGLIKKESKILIGPKIKGKIFKVIAEEAKRKRARLFDCSIVEIIKPKNTMKQSNNETIAIAAAQILKIPFDAIQNGIRDYTPLPGRFEIIQKEPLTIFDGAHNPDKIKYLLSKIQQTVQELSLRGAKRRSNLLFKPKRDCFAPARFALQQSKAGRSLAMTKNEFSDSLRNSILIFASVDTKNWRAMLKLLISNFDKIYLTRHNILHRKSANLKKMYNYVVQRCKFRGQAKIFIDPSDALKLAVSEAGKQDLILATGSLYLIGNLKSKVKCQK